MKEVCQDAIVKSITAKTSSNASNFLSLFDICKVQIFGNELTDQNCKATKLNSRFDLKNACYESLRNGLSS
jgi:hypothetical protein